MLSSGSESENHRIKSSSQPESKRNHSESHVTRCIDYKQHDSKKTEFKRSESKKILI